MSPLLLIVVSGFAMAVIALVGSLTLLLPVRTLERVLTPLIALAAGSLVGGALFHLLPESIGQLGNTLSVYAWLVGGFVAFFLLEQYLHWHHCQRPFVQREPLGYLILVADGIHNFIGGLAVGSAFLLDARVGMITWLVAAAHEVPQELGDFAILLHSGWSRRAALAWNFVSGLTFLAGGLAVWAASGFFSVTFLLPFAAGNFLYIGAADLLPQLARDAALGQKLEQNLFFIAGLGILLVLAALD